MKTLLTTTALVAFAAMPALAQETAAPAADANSSAFVTTGEGMEVTADLSAQTLIGKRVYSSNAPVSEEDGFMEVSEEWEDIGEIGDVLLARDGSVEAIILDIGGFLGMGEKQVAVRMEQIQLINDADGEGEYFVVANVDATTLDQAPEFDMATIAGWAAATGAAAENTGEAMVDGTQAVATDAEQTAESAVEPVEETVEESEQMAEAAGEQAEQTAEETEQMVENAAAETEQAAEETEQMAENAAAETEQAAEEAGQEVAEAADTTEAAVDEGATELAENTEATAEEATAETQEMAAAEPATERTAPEMSREGWTTLAAGDMTTEDLEGARLYDVNDELIGEVSALIIDGDGKITRAVLDVGGFLGIGEKSVAMPMDDLQIQTADEGGEVRVYVNATEEELEAMEAYQEEG